MFKLSQSWKYDYYYYIHILLYVTISEILEPN